MSPIQEEGKKSPRETCLLLGRPPAERRRDLDSGSCAERGKLCFDEKREKLEQSDCESESTEARHSDGLTCSSDEISVTEMERRGQIV